MRTLIGFLFAVGTIFTISVHVAGYEIPLPQPEPVSFVKTVEAKCPDQMMSPKFNYQSPCIARVVMELTNFE